MSSPPPPVPASSPQYSRPCDGCGARVEFAPGTNSLVCPYCGHRKELAAPDREVREHDFAALAEQHRKSAADFAHHRFVCSRCGAHTHSDTLSHSCQFCSAPLVADTGGDEQVAPEAVVLFQVDRSAAREALRTWTRSRWFAPGSLKKVADAESMKSTYLPHWTFDARTVSDYTGQRGEYYYVKETDDEGNSREVRKVRWYPASGTVRRDFDDVLVVGTEKVPTGRLKALEPWPLREARPYRPDYLAGHHTLRYDVDPRAGLEDAKQQMASVIRRDCEKDIGGDTQRVSSVETRYRDVTGKLVLLPVWIASYLHGGKSWQVLINGCTGEVHGERPYSAVKIVAAVLAALAVLSLLLLFFSLSGQSGA